MCSYKLHKFETGPAPYTYASKKELIDYFTLMYRKRRLSIAIDLLYKGKIAYGFVPPLRWARSLPHGHFRSDHT